MLFVDREQAAQEFVEMLQSADPDERTETIETFLDAMDNRLRAEISEALDSFLS